MFRQGEAARVGKAGGKLGVAIAALALSCASGAHADGTPAGTLIRNIAAANFDIDGAGAVISSNAVTTRVDELLDLKLVPKSEGLVSVPSSARSDFGISFVLTNNGNGTEAFIIKGTVPGEAVSLSVAIDVDGNGAYDPAVDIDISSDGKTPVIARGGSLNLLIRFNNAPTKAGVLDVTAAPVSGTGARGTILAGKGDDGTDAIVGRVASASVPFTLQTGGGAGDRASLTKSQTVLAPDGSQAPMTGATITYRLALATTGGETLQNAEIVDAIPANTLYVPGSIRLDGAAISDAADGDPASFDGTKIRVALGDLALPTTKVVTFQVIIQ